MPTTSKFDPPSDSMHTALVKGAVAYTREHVAAFIALMKEFDMPPSTGEIVEFASSVYRSALPK